MVVPWRKIIHSMRASHWAKGIWNRRKLEWQTTSHLLHLFGVFLHLFEIKGVYLLEFYIGGVLITYTYLIKALFWVLNPSWKTWFKWKKYGVLQFGNVLFSAYTIGCHIFSTCSPFFFLKLIWCPDLLVVLIFTTDSD